MSAKVLQFTPRSELDPESNLNAFIRLCRESEVLNARNQFDKNVWLGGRRKGCNNQQRLIFSTFEAARKRTNEPILAQPFLDFAKALIVYLQDHRPVKSFGVRLITLRCLEAALHAWNKGSRPTAINIEVLDTAVELAKENFVPGTAYRIAGQLRIIAELLRTKRFIVLRQPWEHGQKKPNELGSRISKEALAARQSKLPSAAVLRAIAAIFHSATEIGDVVVSSYCALMLSAPERVNEALRLRRNCMVEGQREFVGKFGLRWPGSKGADYTTKWQPSEMAPVAREAISNLLSVSLPAQEIAAWYTANPNKLFIHPGAKQLEGKALLTTRDIALLLWGDEELRGPATLWARLTQKIKPASHEGDNLAYRFSDVERAVLAMLPDTFPYMPGDSTLLCQDSIAITRKNEMSRQRSTFLCMFSCVSYDSLNSRFCTSKKTPTIFERFGYFEDDGSKIDFQTHALRHYLNMLAQIGGLSSTEIAIFSGRKEVSKRPAHPPMNP